MKRYQGEPLPEQPLIAVIANDALGNYAVSSPLLQMLRAKFPDGEIHYYSGTRVQELWSVDEVLDWGWPLHGSEPSQSLYESEMARADDDGEVEVYDLIVNIEWTQWPACFAAAIADEDTYICGPCLAPDGRSHWAFPDDARGDLWRDQRWISEDLTDRYPFLNTGFIGEIFCRLAYLDGPVPTYAIPSEAPNLVVPDVLIATSASLPEKLWPTEKWLQVVRHLHGCGKSIGLVGAKPKVGSQFWRGSDTESELVNSGMVQDLRGEMSLPQVVGALGLADTVLTLDNGIMHLAASTGTPTIGLYRHGIHRLWAPPYKNLKVITPGDGNEVSVIGVEDVLAAF